MNKKDGFLFFSGIGLFVLIAAIIIKGHQANLSSAIILGAVITAAGPLAGVVLIIFFWEQIKGFLFFWNKKKPPFSVH